MNLLVQQLSEMYRLKVSGKDEGTKRDVIARQLTLVESKFGQARSRHEAAVDIVKSLWTAEKLSFCNEPINKINKILNEKYFYENISYLLEADLKTVHDAIETLRTVLHEQKGNATPSLLAIEEGVYATMTTGFAKFSVSTQIVAECFHDIAEMRYSKKSIESGRIIAKGINGSVFRVRCTGLEMIPAYGPCIIAPHHYHNVVDPLALYAVIDRPLFFLTAVEGFIPSRIWGKVLWKLGSVPFRRDDAKYNQRKENTIPAAVIDRYQALNTRALKDMLVHLKHGDAIGIFPEGDAKIGGSYQRFNDEEFIAAQNGTVKIAMTARSEFGSVIPIFPIGMNFSHGYRNARINIGAPLLIQEDTRNLPRARKEELVEHYTALLMQDIIRLSTM